MSGLEDEVPLEGLVDAINRKMQSENNIVDAEIVEPPVDFHATGYAAAFDIYHQRGWPVVPIPKGRKKHPPTGFTGRDGAVPSYADMLEWAESDNHRDGNTAIRLPRNVIGIDVDNYDGKTGAATLTEAVKRWGELPPSYRSSARNDGVSGIRLYRIPEGVALAESIKFSEMGLGGIEICQFHHRYVMCWPSTRDDLGGRQYCWYTDPDEMPGVGAFAAAAINEFMPGLKSVYQDHPPALDDIPELPAKWVEALTEPDRNGAELPPDGPYDVRAAITEGDMSPRVQLKLAGALGELYGSNCRHDEILRKVAGLLRCGKNAEPGVKRALQAMREAFANVVGPVRTGGRAEAIGEFNRMVTGERIAKLLADPDYDNDEPDAGENGNTESSDQASDFKYIVTLVPASEIVSDIPDWVWEYEDLGRLQLGVLTLFAGRPGAGKSTAARWFAAQISKGALDGCWKNKPRKVAYIASEESREQVVKPGLQLAGANMDNIVFPEVTFNGEAVALMSDRDEAELTKQLQAQDVAAIFVDPIMSTIRRKVDIYRNNDLRDALNPWVHIAQRINGIVGGVVHLVKGNSGDVVASVNGSSAFGEVARCVFGFAKDPQNDGERVMSQVKNACGVEDLSLSFEIDVKLFTADTGRKGLMPVFSITGDSDTTVGEVLSTVGGKLRASTQQVLDFVNSRTETGAEAVVDAGLAKTQGTAHKILNRLYQRGLIDRPAWGHYCPKTSKAPK
jgi:hypothetical protein